MNTWELPKWTIMFRVNFRPISSSTGANSGGNTLLKGTLVAEETCANFYFLNLFFFNSREFGCGVSNCNIALALDNNILALY